MNRTIENRYRENAMSQEARDDLDHGDLGVAIRDRLRDIDLASTSEKKLAVEMERVTIQASQAFLLSEGGLESLIVYFINAQLIAIAGLASCRAQLIDTLRVKGSTGPTELAVSRDALLKQGYLASKTPEDAEQFLINEKRRFDTALFQLIFCAEYETFETFLCQLYAIFAYCVPQAWIGREAAEQKALSVKDLLGSSSLAELRLTLAENRAAEFVRSESINNMLDKLSAKFKEKPNLVAQDVQDIRVYSAMRNCFVHNRGVVDRSYIEILKQIGIKARPTVGDTLEVTQAVLGSAQDAYLRICMSLVDQARKACLRLVKHDRAIAGNQ